MKIHVSGTAIGAATIPTGMLGRDWFGDPVEPPVRFALGTDSEYLHFFAARRSPAVCHPDSVPGKFQAELWRYDVAEFFLGAPDGGPYLEFNLAPNGAWWACEFRGPREAVDPNGLELPGVFTEGALDPGGWQASGSLPLAALRERFSFGPGSRLDATFILESPDQRFLCASEPSGGDPDFHRPGAWPTADFVPL